MIDSFARKMLVMFATPSLGRAIYYSRIVCNSETSPNDTDLPFLPNKCLPPPSEHPAYSTIDRLRHRMNATVHLVCRRRAAFNVYILGNSTAIVQRRERSITLTDSSQKSRL